MKGRLLTLLFSFNCLILSAQDKVIDATNLLSKYRMWEFISKRNILDSLSIKINREPLNEFLNFLADQKITTSQDKDGYKTIEKMAERLITLIKKEYHLEN